MSNNQNVKVVKGNVGSGFFRNEGRTGEILNFSIGVNAPGKEVEWVKVAVAAPFADIVQDTIKTGDFVEVRLGGVQDKGYGLQGWLRSAYCLSRCTGADANGKKVYENGLYRLTAPYIAR